MFRLIIQVEKDTFLWKNKQCQQKIFKVYCCVTVWSSVWGFGILFQRDSGVFLWGHVTQHPVIIPPGRWSRHWAGSEVGARSGWGPMGPPPGNTPHPRSLHGPAASSRRCCSFPCRHTMWPGWCWEGCRTCRSSAASHPAEPGNSAEEECQLSFKNLRASLKAQVCSRMLKTSLYVSLETSCYVNKEVNKAYQQDVAVSTWASCRLTAIGPVSGRMTASPQNITLSCSDGLKAICWSSSAERTPGPMTWRMNHTLTWTPTNNQYIINHQNTSNSG